MKKQAGFAQHLVSETIRRRRILVRSVGDSELSAGFAHIWLVVAVAVAVVGFVGWRVFSNNHQSQSSSTTSSQSGTTKSKNPAETVTWSRTENGWKVSGTPPACPDPLLKSPIDISLATNILYPGQLRGGNYKPHGGFRFDDQKDNAVSVTAPLDAELAYASRYIEMGEVQYLLDFVAPCGYDYRFDHLLVLDPKFQAVIDKLPQAQENVSQTYPVSPRVAVKAGDTVATQIGMNKDRLNVFVDFGLYDMRTKNESSKDGAWAAAHPYANEQYAVCWFDFLPAADAAAVRALPSADGNSGKTSDYCK